MEVFLVSFNRQSINTFIKVCILQIVSIGMVLKLFFESTREICVLEIAPLKAAHSSNMNKALHITRKRKATKPDPSSKMHE